MDFLPMERTSSFVFVALVLFSLLPIAVAFFLRSSLVQSTRNLLRKVLFIDKSRRENRISNWEKSLMIDKSYYAEAENFAQHILVDFE